MVLVRNIETIMASDVHEPRGQKRRHARIDERKESGLAAAPPLHRAPTFIQVASGAPISPAGMRLPLVVEHLRANARRHRI